MNFAKLSSKIVLCFLTLLFWGAAAGLSYIGAMILMTYERYGDILAYLHSIIPAIIILSVALLMFIIGLLGVCGLFSENRCLLGTYFSLLALLLGFEIASFVLLYMFRASVNMYVRSVFNDVMSSYGNENSTKLTQNFDYIQYKLQCCGELNYTDWKETWWYKNSRNRWGDIPQSCCSNYILEDNTNLPAGVRSPLSMSAAHQSILSGRFCKGQSPKPIDSDDFYVSGCYSLLRSTIQRRFVYIAAIVLVMVIIQFIGLISTCILMFCRASHKGKQQPPYINIATHEDAQYNM